VTSREAFEVEEGEAVERVAQSDAAGHASTMINKQRDVLDFARAIRDA